MIEPDGEELEGVFEAMRRFQASIIGDSTEFWLDVRLTPPQLTALNLIRRAGRLSGRQLARALGVSPGAVVALCDRLQERGFVERVPDDVDRRITWFQLTEAGTRLFSRMRELSSRTITPALNALSEEDRAHLIRILDALTAGVEASRSDHVEGEDEVRTGT